MADYTDMLMGDDNGSGAEGGELDGAPPVNPGGNDVTAMIGQLVGFVAQLTQANQKTNETMQTFLEAEKEAREAERLAREAREGPRGKAFSPNVGKIKEFSGFASEMSPREWLSHARTRFSTPTSGVEEDDQVRRAAASLAGPALVQWNNSIKGGDVLTWDLLENFLLTHYGRMEDPEVLLQQLDKLTLASTGGSIATYVSKFVTILARLGMERPNRENVVECTS
jgi:hypothetical protein